jgi:hypothetical protein
VLILTPQPMAGALLGMLVELAQLEPVFAQPEERPEDAFSRVLPLLVILADAQVDAFRSDLFLARARHRGVGVIVFGHDRHEPNAEWAAQHNVPYLVLPTDAEAFGRLIDEAVRNDRRERLAGDRRAGSHTERAIDGTLVFHDEAGRRWYVYDRRSGQRRQAQPSEGTSYRVFVNDAGVEYRCRMEAHEFRDRTPAALESQLARATPD